jgi:hypothetical protein
MSSNAVNHNRVGQIEKIGVGWLGARDILYSVYTPNKLATTSNPATATTPAIRAACFPPAASPVNVVILAVGPGVSVGLTIAVPLLGATGHDEGIVEQVVVVVIVLITVVVAGTVVSEVEAAVLVEDEDVGAGRVIVTLKLRAH